MLQSSSRGGGWFSLVPGGFSLVQGGGSPWSRGEGGVLLGPGGVCLSGGGSPCQGGLPGPGGEFSLPGGGSPETPSPPVYRITDTCKNITLATTSLRPVKILAKQCHLKLSEEIWIGKQICYDQSAFKIYIAGDSI